MLRPGDACRLDLLATLPAQDADETARASASGDDRASATPLALELEAAWVSSRRLPAEISRT